MRASMTWLGMYTAQWNKFSLKKVRLELVHPLHRYEQANMHSHKQTEEVLLCY